MDKPKIAESLTHLGTSGRRTFSKPDKNILECFPAPEGVNDVEFHTKEMTSFCPVTGQPDWETVTIFYNPKGKCVESKSLKLYLQSFRSEAAFMESLSARICKDLSDVLQPFFLVVTVESSPRGGLGLKATSRYECPIGEM